MRVLQDVLIGCRAIGLGELRDGVHDPAVDVGHVLLLRPLVLVVLHELLDGLVATLASLRVRVNLEGIIGSAEDRAALLAEVLLKAVEVTDRKSTRMNSSQ